VLVALLYVLILSINKQKWHANYEPQMCVQAWSTWAIAHVGVAFCMTSKTFLHLRIVEARFAMPSVFNGHTSIFDVQTRFTHIFVFNKNSTNIK